MSLYHNVPKTRPQTTIVDLPKKTNDIFVEIVFPAGYLYAPNEKREVPHLLEHYLYNHLAKTGLDCFAGTSVRSLSLYAVISRRKLSKELPIFLKSVLFNNMDDQKTFQTEQKILLNELSGILSNESELAHRLALNKVTNQQIYTTSIEQYQRITLEDVADYYKRQCHTEATRLFIGAHDADDIFVNEISAVLENTITAYKEHLSTVVNNTLGSFSISNHDLGISRTHLNLTFGLPKGASNPTEQIALLLILDLLSDQDDGLIINTLRAESGLIYDLETHIDYYPGFGFISVNTSLMPNDLQTGISIIFGQIKKVQNQEFSKIILRKFIKDHILGDKKKYRSNWDRFYWIMNDILDRNLVYSIDEWLNFYPRLTPEYIADIAKKYLNCANLQVVTVGGQKNPISQSQLKDLTNILN